MWYRSYRPVNRATFIYAWMGQEGSMEWSRIRSIAQEAELWLSLAVNGWFVFRAGAFVIRRIGSTIAIAETMAAASFILLGVTIATGIRFIYKRSLASSALVDWRGNRFERHSEHVVHF
jgi:hypothetical protein